MSRAQRLLQLLELLRSHRYPIGGAQLAARLGISLRTLYRDIGTLQEQGAHIVGEAGLGYVLRPGFTLPPLMFQEEELEALVLGLRWTIERGDPPLAASARTALDKISAVLPDPLRGQLDGLGLLIAPGVQSPVEAMPALRQALRTERILELVYRDLKGNATTRTIWPIAIGYFDQFHMLAAWCELRQDFRDFRCDRIEGARVTSERFPRPRHDLLREWHQREGIPPQAPADKI